MPRFAKHFRELEVYQASLDAAMVIFRISGSFPAEERFSMTSQMRRSSRSVCANLAEAWRKRRYAAAFVGKLSDAEGEAAETQVWLDLAQRSRFISKDEATQLDARYEVILGMLVKMIDRPEKWIIR